MPPPMPILPSLPTRERELKPGIGRGIDVGSLSLPTRERELKPDIRRGIGTGGGVAPHAGARIETL